jgi:phenylpyruvate tautomerase PptA (4-oxalocrotonate tautomerase family)
VRAMPLFTFTVTDTRTDEQVSALLDAAYAAQTEALETVDGDRYQVVHARPASHLRIEDTGLGIERSDAFVLIQVTTSPRTEEQKSRLYELLVQNLQRDAGIEPNDVMVSIVENTKGDWSFGHGRAQYLTGEL